jgi:hypothetical protein
MGRFSKEKVSKAAKKEKEGMPVAPVMFLD